LNKLQSIYLNVINAIVNVDGVFDTEFGDDIQYGLKNYIAKYSLANDEYWISERAFNILSEMEYKEPFRRSSIYKIKDHEKKWGNSYKKLFIFEHPIPANYMRSWIIQSDRKIESIKNILCKTDFVAILTQEEDNEIAKDLKSSMPKKWQLGDSPFARYENTQIKIMERKVKMCGAIKR
jgi:hypothetical protein